MEGKTVRTDFDEAPEFGVWHGQPYTSMPSHLHDHVEINYAAGGSLTYLLAGSVVRVPPGKLSLFWAGMPHSVVDRTEVERFYWIYIPLVWILCLGLPGSFMRRVMGGDMLVDTAPTEADRVMLDRWSEELPHADEVRKRLITWEVETRVMRLAMSQTDEASDGHVLSWAGPAQKVADMARFVAEHHDGALRIRDVAHHVGLHPNYAMTLFRRHYGMTLSAYHTRLRVCQAQNLLVSTDLGTSQIAFEVGFGSVSRFYESFKTVSGCTPRQYRAQTRLVDEVSKSPYNPCSRRGSANYNPSCPPSR